MNPPPHDPDASARIERLEARVAELESEVAALRQAPPAGDNHASTRPASRRSRRRPPRPRGRLASWRTGWQSEEWLNRLGVGLLLFGVAFLFKYSVDAGWLTPLVRVLIGGGLGAFLLAAGLRIRHRAGGAPRVRFGQFLLGGSIATFYGTLFAAFQLYALLPHAAAFVGMVGVTLLAFGLAIRQGEAALAVVGVVGGLATPFLLYTEAGSIPGLVGYTLVVTVGAAAVYALRGWRTLLAVAYAGAWAVLAFAIVTATWEVPAVAPADRWALRAGVVAAWVLFLGMTVAFAWRRTEALHPLPAGATARLRAALLLPLRRPDATLAFSAPLLALRYAMELWALSDAAWGGLALGGAALYAGLAAGLAWRRTLVAAQASAGAAAALLAYGLAETLPEPLALVAVATEAVGLHLLARRSGWPAMRLAGHLLFGGLALVLLGRFDDPGLPMLAGARGTPPLLHADALADLAVLVLAAFAAVYALHGRARGATLLVAHVLGLYLLLVELRPLPSGQAFVSMAWGAYAVGLLVLGVWRDRAGVRNVALATILLVVGKLFLVDLDRLDPLWRVVLFLGFGGLFLLLSYWLSGRLGAARSVEEWRGEMGELERSEMEEIGKRGTREGRKDGGDGEAKNQ